MVFWYDNNSLPFLPYHLYSSIKVKQSVCVSIIQHSHEPSINICACKFRPAFRLNWAYGPHLHAQMFIHFSVRISVSHAKCFM